MLNSRWRAALFLLAAAPACRKPVPVDDAPAQPTTTAPPSPALADAIGRRLESFSAVVGETKRQGPDILLVKDALRLSARDQGVAEHEAPNTHFHVLLHADSIPGAPFEACIAAVGEADSARFENAADNYVSLGLPPALSFVRRDPVFNATRFHGDEPWAVAGYRGYVGGSRALGLPEEIVRTAPIFSGARFPRDGKVHQLKSVLMFKGGRWLRTVELDGPSISEPEAPFAGLPPSSDPSHLGLLIRYAVFKTADREADSAARAAALQAIASRPAWLSASGGCIADALPSAFHELAFGERSCAGGRLEDCLSECEGGSATSCYEVGLEMQETHQAEALSTPFYETACRLGGASACTNAAAATALEKTACASRTFEAVCDRDGDPWACGMFGLSLMNAKGKPDVARARAAFTKACARDLEDPACVAATKLSEKLKQGDREAPPGAPRRSGQKLER